MGFLNDTRRNLSHFSKVISLGFKTLPTVRDHREGLRNFGNAKFQHGVDVGMRRASMYYPGADSGVMRNDWPKAIRTATAIIREDFKTICARAELAFRTDAVARRVVNLLVDFVAGQGNQPYPAIKLANGDMVEGVNAQLAADWERFNDQGIRNGTAHLTMYQGQRLKCAMMIVYGSVLQNVIRSRPGSLLPWAFQILKPTRLDFSKDTYISNTFGETISNNVIHGMKLNAYGEAEKYYFEGETVARNADDIDLTFFPIETEQYLGLSWLTPILPPLYDRQSLLYDKLKTSRIGARLGMQIPKDMQEGIEGLKETDGNGNTFLNLDFIGMVSSDKDLKPIAITDPISDTFKPLVRMMLQEIAIGAGFSHQLLTSDLEDTNFTSGRINTIVDSKTFGILFKQFVKSSNQLDWNRFVEWEAFTGRLNKYGVGYAQYLSDPWYYSQCYWLPKDGEEWVEPLKDAQALILLYKTGQITYQEICSKAGKNYKSVIKQLSKEREEMKAAGLESMLPENISTSPKAANKTEKNGRIGKCQCRR